MGLDPLQLIRKIRVLLDDESAGMIAPLGG